MPVTIYFVDYPRDFSEASLEFKKGDELLDLIINDDTLKIENEYNTRTVYYNFDDKWKKFFYLERNGDISLNYRVVEDSPELYYKLVELASKLSLCIEVEDILAFIPEYGLLMDLEDPEQGSKYEIYSYEIHEKIEENSSLTITEVIKEIEFEKDIEIAKEKEKIHHNSIPISFHEDEGRKKRKLKLFLIILIVVISILSIWLG